MDLGSLPDFPEWLMKLLLALTIFGALCVVALLGLGLYAAISHIQWR